MKHEEPPNVAQQKSLDKTQKDIRAIATEVDFKPYLEAVSMASQRTRFTVYVLIAALLLIITTYRNTASPDWTNSRLTQFQLAYACLQDSSASSECVEAIKYAKGFMLLHSDGPEPLSLDKEWQLELREQINDLIKQRTDALTLHLPFFGLAIDMNDLGMMGGFLLASILYVLYASLSSETENIERAKGKAAKINDKNMREDYLELLLMHQVLSSPSKAKIGIGKGLYVLFILVAAVHLWVCYDDRDSFHVAVTLEGKGAAVVDTILEWTFCALVIFFCSLCFWQQRKLNKSLRSLADSV
ncbi:MAG: hypothetical protein QOE33_3250 [Acidobacteriota bacterium]|nr:hypothetical protein [Acidobacteriota bacterium]